MRTNSIHLRQIAVAIFFFSPFSAAAQPAEGWISTGPPQVARKWHSVTTLQNGWVLAAGGVDISSVNWLNSAELYKPETGQWHSTGPMVAAARGFHTATLLESGQVLVAGGWNGNALGEMDSAEIFDPGQETWISVGSLVSARTDHSATRLPDGRVLIVGGHDGLSSLSSAEVFDPTTQSFSLGPPLTAARSFHTATRLRDGRVLVVGGSDGKGKTISSAEVFDPRSWSWSGTGGLSASRFFHTASLLPDGRVLVTGGDPFHGFGNGMALSEVYDPTAGRWNPTGHLNNARLRHKAVTLSDGRVLILSGFESSGSSLAVEIFDPARGQWGLSQPLANTNGFDTVAMLPDGRVVVAFGQTANLAAAYMDFVQLMYPQLALGGGFEAVLLLSNQAPEPWVGRAELNSGMWPGDRPWSLNGQDRAGEDGFQIVLEPGRTAKYTLTSSQGPFSGWLEIRSCQPLAHLSTSFFYNFYSGGVLVDSTGVAPARGLHRQRFPVERSDSVNTGIAMQRSGEVLMTLYDSEGQEVESLVRKEQGARFFDEIFQGVPPDFIGSVEVSSPNRVFLTVLRQEVISTSPLEFQLTSVPATEWR